MSNSVVQLPTATTPLISSSDISSNKYIMSSIWYKCLSNIQYAAAGLTPQLAALSVYNSPGIMVQVDTTTFAGRSITGTANRITITNGSGIFGNPVVNIASTYIGQTSITTLGTISAGTWNGTTIAVLHGGTGVTTSTGTGSVVLNTSPTFVTPLLGTPTSGVLTTCTGLPLTTGVTGILPIANGGTSTASLPTGILVGDGTGAITALTNVPWTTFTPTVTSSVGGDTIPVYSSNLARYRQIDNLVFMDVYLSGDGGDEGAGSGQLRVALPVTAAATNMTGYVPVGFAHTNTKDRILYAQVQPSATYLELDYIGTGATLVILTPDDQDNATRSLRIKMFYEV